MPEPSGRPSDADDSVLATGRGDTVTAIVSMSAKADTGDDAAYLAWHLLDHLPEQYRLPGLRLGQRWVSTPACRALRVAEAPPFDQVDHVVAYLFADPVADHLDGFFELGRALHAAGRMPLALPRVDLAAYDLTERSAAERVRVGADVIPWRSARGAYLIIEPSTAPSAPLAELAALPGVAGAWRFAGSDRHRPDRLAPAAGRTLTVVYLDADPTEVAPHLGRHVADDALLGAPFHVAVASDSSRHLP